VTGANRGIGLELVRQYAADGWTVVATCRRPDQAAELAVIGGDVHVYRLDVTDFAQIEQLARALDGIAVDVLINNAGVYGPRVVPYDFVDYAVWAEVMRTNAMAPLKLSAVFSKHVARSQRRLIVAMTSNMGSITDNTSGGNYIYRSTKAALNAVTRSLAIDLRSKEITVVAVHPGWVRTDMGGSGAILAVDDSVRAMRDLFDRLTLRDSGRFLRYDGTELAW
jgi:NAD(P)-dependent dehydrogenase (short-subunit alcohol dehydrogenase family)